ncbi:MAG: histidine phosphatase family protein, partial [Actinobacteria bacterium]|nr:histidine phosphatase family protein [Actinomycetota bacterium]
TWRLAAAELGATPPVRFDDRLYRASAPDLLGLARRAPSPVRTLLIVGHDPAIHDLAVTLAGSGSGAAAMAGRMRVKFPTGAVAVLEFTGNWDQLGGEGTRLTSFVTPREVEAS